MVTGPKDVASVLNGETGVLAASNRDGKIVIQMSTIDEESTVEFSELVQTRGMRFVDCPVAGSLKQVQSAELILLAGADEKVLKMVEPILKSMGKAIIHAGEIGKGSALKLCMNLIVAQMTTAICESVALAKVQSINPQLIFDVIKESPAINCGYFRIKENNLLNETYAPAFSLSNMLKDIKIIDHTAKMKRLPLPVNQAVRFLMENAKTEGYGDEDLSSIAKLLRPKINTEG